MRVIDNLRPVEALFLLNHAGIEKADKYDISPAILNYLKEYGYIRTKKRISITEKGLRKKDKVPGLEKDCLELIANGTCDDFDGLVSVLKRDKNETEENVYISLLDLMSGRQIKVDDTAYITEKGKNDRIGLGDYEIMVLNTLELKGTDYWATLEKIRKKINFEEVLAGLGFFKKGEKKSIFKIKGIYIPTEKYNKALIELDYLKNRIKEANPRTNDKYLISMSYAFPASFLWLRFKENIFAGTEKDVMVPLGIFIDIPFVYEHPFK